LRPKIEGGKKERNFFPLETPYRKKKGGKDAPFPSGLLDAETGKGKKKGKARAKSLRTTEKKRKKGGGEEPRSTAEEAREKKKERSPKKKKKGKRTSRRDT